MTKGRKKEQQYPWQPVRIYYKCTANGGPNSVFSTTNSRERGRKRGKRGRERVGLIVFLF